MPRASERQRVLERDMLGLRQLPLDREHGYHRDFVISEDHGWAAQVGFDSKNPDG